MERRPVNELVSDLGRIGHDVDCLSRKVDSIKNKVSDFPEKNELFAQAQLIRKERDTKINIRRQFEEEQNKLADLKRKQEVLSLQMHDLHDLNEDGNPETALNRLEQDSEILKHIVEEKLPRQIDIAKRKYLAYRITDENPPFCSSDLEFRKQRMDEVSHEIQIIMNNSSSSNNKSSLLRNSIVEGPMINYANDQLVRSSQKKIDLAENLQVLEQDFTKVIKLLDEKRDKYEMLFGGGGDARNETMMMPLKKEEYKTYVRSVRVKATLYKEMRKELQLLQSELGNLSVTKYILEGELKYSEDELVYTTTFF
jgi:hypothetical protein